MAKRFPTLLTLEDFIARSEHIWGFSDENISQARARAAYFDTLAGARRYI